MMKSVGTGLLIVMCIFTVGVVFSQDIVSKKACSLVWAIAAGLFLGMQIFILMKKNTTE